MIRISHFSILFIWLIIFISCEKIEDRDKYRRPDWLTGKLYDQIVENDDLSTFARALQITGYDTIINLSGSYTVFAPTNEAFSLFFTENSHYGDSVSNIPYEELINLVKFHIIQNPWNKVQLKSLNPNGWVTNDDHPINSKPWSYKRQTLLREPNEKYFYKSVKGKYEIVDSLHSGSYKNVYSGNRKFAPIFFDDYFGLNDLKFDDYSFYFGRPYEAGNIYYANAMLGDEYFSENGFIYPVDRVVEPAQNGKQILEEGNKGSSYTQFLNLIYQFPEFAFNKEATFNQTEAKEGRQIDSLFTLTYPDLIFNIHDEEYRGSYSQSTQNHFGLLVPNDNAFQKLLDEVVTSNSGYPHWTSLFNTPDEIKKIIVNAHMSEYPIYRTNIEEGFYNGLDDKVIVDEQNIESTYFGSNCTFISLSEAVVPRAFSSVTGPVYLRPGYSTFMRAMEYTRVLSAVKRQEADYAFYIISDATMSLDSSLLIFWRDIDLNLYSFKALVKSSDMIVNITRNDLSKRILNQVGVSLPTGLGNKEFIENLAGNYIVLDNVNNTAQGSLPNAFGYQGDSLIISEPLELTEPADNGVTYEVASWFRFSNSTLFAIVSSYTKFYNLLVKAKLIDYKNYKFTFISDSDYYTVFVPTNDALTNAQADTLNVEDLEKFLRYHFVRDELIFTDGNKSSGYYETTRQDESSNEFSVKYSKLHLIPGLDYIDIMDQEGNLYYRMNEADETTNMMGIALTGSSSDNSIWNFITTSVVHQIDTVLIK